MNPPFVLFFIFLGVEKDEGFYFILYFILGFFTLFGSFFIIIILVYVVTGAKGYTLIAPDCGIVVRYRYGAIIILLL